jgi:putative flippase GtrA
MNKLKQLLANEMVSYLIVGGLTTVVSLAAYYFLVLLFLDPYNAVQLQIANILSWIAAVSFAYYTNRKYVFHSENPRVLKEASGFFASRLGTLLVDMFMMFLMVTVCGVNDKLAKIIVQIIVIIANYLISKFYVFRR